MRIKIFVSILAIVALCTIIYFEQNNTPYNNFSLVTNNSNTESSIIDLGSSLEKKYQQQKQSRNTKNPKEPHDNKHQNTIELPNFPITILGNKNISNIYDFKYNKIVIHFWASWCNVCKSEFEDIIKYSKQNPNTAVVAISVDDKREELGKYLDSLNTKTKFKSLKNLFFSWDHDKSISLDIFGTEMLPENYIITHHNNYYEVKEKTIGRANWSIILKNT